MNLLNILLRMRWYCFNWCMYKLSLLRWYNSNNRCRPECHREIPFRKQTILTCSLLQRNSLTVDYLLSLVFFVLFISLYLVTEIIHISNNVACSLQSLILHSKCLCSVERKFSLWYIVKCTKMFLLIIQILQPMWVFQAWSSIIRKCYMYHAVFSFQFENQTHGVW